MTNNFSYSFEMLQIITECLKVFEIDKKNYIIGEFMYLWELRTTIKKYIEDLYLKNIKITSTTLPIVSSKKKLL